MMKLFLHVNGALFVLSLSGVFLIFVGYPIVIRFLSFMRTQSTPPPLPDGEEPAVSLLVVLRNAEALAGEKLRNALALDYPPDRLEIVFYLDGSTDGTEDVLRAHPAPNVRVLGNPEHRGKISGINAAVPQCKGNVIVFSDADAILEPNALRLLVRHLADRDIGGVCGQRVIATDTATLQDAQKRYIRFDSAIKRHESRVGSLSSNDGKLYAIRKELFQPIKDAVTDDLYLCLAVVSQGKRFVFEPEARAFIRVPSRNPRHEISRRRRIVSQSLRGIWNMRALFNPLRYGAYSFSFAINRTLRRFLPVMLVVLLLSSTFLAFRDPRFIFLVALQALFYAAAAGYAILFRKLGRPRIAVKASSLAFYFCVGNWGTLLGLVDFFTGRKIAKWTPVKSGGPSRSTRISPLFVDLSRRYGGASARSQDLAEGLGDVSAGLALLANGEVMREARARGLVPYPIVTRKSDPRATARLADITRRNAFALLDCQNPVSKLWGTAASRRAGVALVSTLNSWYVSEHGGNWKGRLYQALERMNTPRTDLFIAVSQEIRRRLLASGVPDAAIAVVPNAVHLDPDRVTADRAWLSRTFGVPEDARVVCAVGRLVPAKGYEYLVDAIARLADDRLCCIIVGEGREHAALTARIRECGVGASVRLPGRQTREDTLKVVKVSDAFAMPSRSEGTPVALLEAAVLKCPIVATNVGGIPELVRDGIHARLIPPCDADGLAHALQSVLGNPDAALGMARAAAGHVAHRFGAAAQLTATREAHAKAVERFLRR